MQPGQWKVEIVLQMKVLATIKEVRQLLRLASFFQEIHSEFRKDRGVDYVTDQEGCYVVLGGKAETGFP